MQKEKREEIIEVTNMVIKLCLMAGSQLSTAYTVGGLFASGLERECEPSNTGLQSDGACTCPENIVSYRDTRSVCSRCGKPRR